MANEFDRSVEFAERLYLAALGVMAQSQFEITDQWNKSPRVIAVTIFGRTLSTFKAAQTLLRDNQTIEARMLARSLYENLLWLAALLERGEAFISDMHQDEVLNRRSLGRKTIRVSTKQGADPDTKDMATLRDILTELSSIHANPQRLSADKVAAMGKLELYYIEYTMLSLDSLHCSLTALNRHIVKEQEGGNHTIITLNVEPAVNEQDRLKTVLLLIRALLGAAVAVHDLVGPVEAFNQIIVLTDEFEANGWATAN